MKLDKMKFARVVAHCVSSGMSAGEYEVGHLDSLIEIEVPIEAKVAVEDVNELLRQIVNPDGFIHAIKAYRVLTGAGLKESKETIERYRNIPNFKHNPPKDIPEGEDKSATLGDILGQAVKK